MSTPEDAPVPGERGINALTLLLTAATDKSLSATALGLLTRLAVAPADWFPSADGLVTSPLDSYDGIDDALAQLVGKGHLTVTTDEVGRPVWFVLGRTFRDAK